MITQVIQSFGLWVPYWTEGATIHLWDRAYASRSSAETAVAEAWAGCRRPLGGIEVVGGLRRRAIFAVMEAEAAGDGVRT
jgi:hypothetical protein